LEKGVKIKPPRKKQKIVEVYEDLMKRKFWVKNFGEEFC
jgi:hypothetical protein